MHVSFLFLIFEVVLPAEMQNCLDREGAPHDCVNYFKTGSGAEGCLQWQEKHGDVMRTWIPRWRNCFDEKVLEQ